MLSSNKALLSIESCGVLICWYIAGLLVVKSFLGFWLTRPYGAQNFASSSFARVLLDSSLLKP
jgi:hypothetical protein